MRPLSGTAGIYHVGFAFLCVPIAAAAIGLQILLSTWNHQAETQLRLDECVGKKAVLFRNSLNHLSSLNLKVQGVRLMIPESSLTPAARAALQTLLQTLFFSQEMIRKRWGLEIGCHAKGDFSLPLPEIPAHRDLPDSIGPMPLTWDFPETSAERLKITAFHPPRGSSAQIKLSEKSEKSIVLAKLAPDWRAEWVSP